jgi:hypothetical protein
MRLTRQLAQTVHMLHNYHPYLCITDPLDRKLTRWELLIVVSFGTAPPGNGHWQSYTVSHTHVGSSDTACEMDECMMRIKSSLSHLPRDGAPVAAVDGPDGGPCPITLRGGFML